MPRTKQSEKRQRGTGAFPTHVRSPPRIDRKIDYDELSQEDLPPSKRKGQKRRLDQDDMELEEEEVLEKFADEMKKTKTVMEILNIRRATIDKDLKKRFNLQIRDMFHGFGKEMKGFDHALQTGDDRSKDLMGKLNLALSKGNADMGMSTILEEMEVQDKKMNQQKMTLFLSKSAAAQEQIAEAVKSFLEDRALLAESHKIERKVRKRRLETLEMIEHTFNVDNYAKAIEGLMFE